MKSRIVIALLMTLVMILSGPPYLAATLLFSHGHHHVSLQQQGATTTLVFHHHEGKNMHEVGHAGYQDGSPYASGTGLVLLTSYLSGIHPHSEEANDHTAQLPSQTVQLSSRQLNPMTRFEPILLFPTSESFPVPTISDLRLSLARSRDNSMLPRFPAQLRSVILLI